MICPVGGEYECLSVSLTKIDLMPCSDCPADFGFWWDWRAYGGALSILIGRQFGRERICLALLQATAEHWLLDIVIATGGLPE